MLNSRQFTNIVESIDIELLPPDPYGRTLESIEVFLRHRTTDPSPGERASQTYEIRMWFGDVTVWQNVVVGFITYWATGALTYSPHLHSFAPFMALVTNSQFDLLVKLSGK